ncbi:hypothetical protein QYM36_002415, partial [Artemia franciscana]
RDSSGYPLVCELANIALNYYKGRTIANSPSLRTADASSEDAGIASLWRSIALMRKAAPRDVIMTYYGAIKGEDVAQSLGRIVEADDAAFDNEKTQLENRINNGTIDIRKLACLPVQLIEKIGYDRINYAKSFHVSVKNTTILAKEIENSVKWRINNKVNARFEANRRTCVVFTAIAAASRIISLKGDNGGFGSTDPLQIQQPDLSKTTGRRKRKSAPPDPQPPPSTPTTSTPRTYKKKKRALLTETALMEERITQTIPVNRILVKAMAINRKRREKKNSNTRLLLVSSSFQ